MNIQCHYEADFQLSKDVKAPTTYREAIEFARNFPQILYHSIRKDTLAGNEPLGVPVIVWLYPLTLEDGTSVPVLPFNEMRDTLIYECVRQMENYAEVEGKLAYMLNDPLATRLNPFHKKLQDFQQHFASFLVNLRSKLREIVMEIRKGFDSVDSFKQLLNDISYETFVFNSKRLSQWLEEKYNELCAMQRFHHQLIAHEIGVTERVALFPCAETLQEQMTKHSVNFGFELGFSSLASPEPFLDLIKNQTLNLDITNENLETTINDGDLWYKNNGIVKRIEKEIEVVARLIKSKLSDLKFAFAITAPDEYNQIVASESSIIVHQQQKKTYGWDAIQILCQHYPKGNIIDIVRLITDAEITEYWNQLNFLALCRFYEKENLIDMVRLFLERGVDLINCKTEDGWNALLLLCRYYKNENLFDLARLLLARGIDVNCKSNGELNALHLVCRYYEKENLSEIVRLFIERGIDINCQFNEEWNAFLFFCRNYQKDNLLGIVRLFLTKNVDINCKTKGGNNALLFLCRYYDKKNLIEIIRLLLEKGIDVNCKNNEGWNALYLVCRYYERDNLLQIVKLFLKRGIDVNCMNSEGWNALHLVCRYYKKENLINIIKLLLDKNIETNCKTNSGCNVLHNVCRYYPNRNLIEIVQMLLDTGIFVSFTNNEGWNALLNVCRYYPNDNLIELVELFLERGVDVNWVNNEGWNALHLVCRFYKQDNLIDIVELLLDYDIDINSKTKEGCNALHFVCRRHYQKENLVEVVQLLIDSGISVNCKNNEGWNALHNVCRYQQKKNMMDLVPLLIQHKIDKNATTTGGIIGTARSILLGRYKEENVQEILKILDSNVSF
jgi:ankyrin repeat protein